MWFMSGGKLADVINFVLREEPSITIPAKILVSYVTSISIENVCSFVGAEVGGPGSGSLRVLFM